MSITGPASLTICILGTILSIAAIVAGHWISGGVGLLISGGLWYNHYRTFMIEN
jgi:hypothetical protein